MINPFNCTSAATQGKEEKRKLKRHHFGHLRKRNMDRPITHQS